MKTFRLFAAFAAAVAVCTVVFVSLARAQATEAVPYEGKPYHIFFHSLVVYPEKAFTGTKSSKLYEDHMVTRDEFLKILPELYKNGFVIVDIGSLYGVRDDGTVVRKQLFVPRGKKPLVISLDDLSYYRTMSEHGFARKLVLDEDGNVATEIREPDGTVRITRDGDIVPILDDFVAAHPDFSMNGAKGVIAVTGYDGILGYRTNRNAANGGIQEAEGARKIAARLRETGWRFASHSYSHDKSLSTGAISLSEFRKDTDLWDREVRPLVGDTDIFIGPFGQIFGADDARRKYLLSKGFRMFCGVGMERYLKYRNDSVIMDRADIDGYRLVKTPRRLSEYFDPAGMADRLRRRILE